MEEKKETIKSEIALREEAVLQFWRDNKIFEKSLEKDSSKGEFVFFEGPPTANAKPALHHLEARAFKDVIPRYKTMRGYHVRRKAGWDTHGLPVELQIEKKLGLNSKKEIEKYGIAEFNKECKESVHEYIGLWKEFSERMAFSVDFDDAYYTYDNSYIESLWHIVDHVNKKGLMYKDYKIVPWCARCGTALSSHELAQEYKDVKDLSAYAKFPIVGFPKAYFLAWTTTPWTLPGNVALAVGSDIDYVEAKIEEEIYVLAKERISILGENYEIIAEHKGSEMAGMQYEPIYNVNNKNENSHKIYVADFVTTTDGTGIVHIAPMYGADDFDLATKNDLPKTHTVDTNGNFLPDIAPFTGRFVKDENFDIDIIKDLAHRGLLFKKEKYEHNYPHCWRCKTPLLYYARDSWYFAISKLKDKLIASNENINWEPAHIKEGRFGEWLRNLKDWAISRERYWGTPIPAWMKKDGSFKTIGSISDLKKYTKKSGNKYFVMRHGETEANKLGIICSMPSGNWHLDEEGIRQVKNSGENLKNQNIDLIFTSDFTRTKETAKLVAETLGLDEKQIIVTEKLREIGAYSFDGKSWEEYHAFHTKTVENFNKRIADDESYEDVKNRMTKFLYEVEENYKGKNILFVTHGGPAWLMFAGASGKTANETLEMIIDKKDFHYFQNAEVKELSFVSLPHNEKYELDLHKPYIDEVELVDENGEKMERVKEVMDVWFDSGAMPYAQDHFPFEKEKNNPKYFPADFISEAVDQTRGWFYTLVAVAALFDKETPMKNVICLGHLLDAQGQKMSKSKGNVIDPWEEMNKWGADTVRMWMYSVSQPGDSKNYDEKVVRELHGKVFTLLSNVMAFYELYRDKNLENNEKIDSQNVLDIWILSRLNEFTKLTTEGLDKYDIFNPARGFRDFIDDLSTWYLRRSRERLKDGDKNAKQTLYYVLKNLAKLLAPFAPFASEEVWQKLKLPEDVESVHLAKWPEVSWQDNLVIPEMIQVRNIVSLALKERQKSGIPVRQPLSKLKVKGVGIFDNYIGIIKDEVNIKDIFFDEKLESEVELDITITPELKREGLFRELVRGVQELRKKRGFTPSDKIIIKLSSNSKNILDLEMIEILKKMAIADQITFDNSDGERFVLGEDTILVNIQK